MEYQNIKESLGTSFQKLLLDSTSELNSQKVIDRLWEKDYTIWNDKPDEISNRLGWLDSPENSLKSIDEINQFVSSVKKDGFTHALLLGMGGSSLAPEVFRLVFGVREGFLDLKVIDTTHPDAVLNIRKQFDSHKTLFIVSTKSGGTVETFSLMKYFYNLTMKKAGAAEAGNSFVAITDPGSGLESVARQLNFRKIFLNDPNIGGRYSALSLFGVVPAALIGVDLIKLLDKALRMGKESRNSDISKNPSARVGIILGALAGEGLDKATFVCSSELAPFGNWVEQLIAESTGKSGKGIVPVIGEELTSPEYYSGDRLFIYFHLKNDTSLDHDISKLLNANPSHKVVEISIEDYYDLSGEFLKWEIATAIASWKMKIQPFDQPNVESAKILARKMVQDFKEKGTLSEPIPTAQEGSLTAFGSKSTPDVKSALGLLLDAVKGERGGAGHYFSIQAYLAPDEQTSKKLQLLRTLIQKKYKIATTIGYGPRFLHSTGQLHKGDAGSGLFLQLTSTPINDQPIPDEAGNDLSTMSFGILIKSQALGDRQALLDNHRSLLTIDLGKNVYDSLDTIIRFFS